MVLTEHKNEVSLEEIMEKEEGLPCNTLIGARDLIAAKLKKKFPSGIEKILLINPPMTTKDNFDLNMARTQSYPCYPPYGLGLLSSQLENRGYITKITDLNLELMKQANASSPEQFDYDRTWKEKIDSLLGELRPDMIGITCMYTMMHPSMQNVVEFIRTKDEITPIIAGGAHPALAAEDVLRKSSGIDFISLYESDNSFPDMVDFVNDRVVKNKLTQLTTLVNDEFVSVSERSVPSSEVITIRPNYQDLPIGKYTDYGKIGVYASWLRGDDTKCSTILKSRGCRAHCSFCSVREFNGRGVRHRPADDVVDEMEWLRDDYGIQHFVWLDDDLLNDKKKTMEIFNKIVDRKLGVTWDASNGVIAAALDEELAHASESSGCIGMSFGIESGNEEILKRIHKPATIDRFFKAAEILDRHPNIYTKGFLIIGFPEDGEHRAETIGQMWDTVALAKKMHLDWYTIQVCMPLPGTEMAQGMEKAGQKRADITNEAVNRFITGFGSGLRSKYELELRSRTDQSFEDILHRDMNYAPNREELKNIWFFLDYYINYEDLKNPTERTNAQKLNMQERWLGEVAKRKSAENPLAYLYLGVLRDRLGMYEGAKQARDIARQYLNKSEFYQARFNYLGLDNLLEQSERGEFRKDQTVIAG